MGNLYSGEGHSDVPVSTLCVCVCVCVCVCETTLGTVVRGADCLVCSESDTLPLLNMLACNWLVCSESSPLSLLNV